MTTKQVRIMYYDEKKRAWVVDTMEVTDNDTMEKSESASGDDTDTAVSHRMAYL